MRSWFAAMALVAMALGVSSHAPAQQGSRPYRLNSVDLDRRVVWGAECRNADGTGLAFGGQDQDADDGRPHTRLLVEGQWQNIAAELSEKSPTQALHNRLWTERNAVKNVLARARHIYFQGYTEADETQHLAREVAPGLLELKTAFTALDAELTLQQPDKYAANQCALAKKYLAQAHSLLPSLADGELADALRALHRAQIQLELAAEALAAEPPPRAMNCGTARRGENDIGPDGNTLVYDPQAKLYLLFGGDHLDYLTNDTWIFDPATKRWFQKHPAGAPPPRANHRLEVLGDGTLRLTGGYTYSSNTDYLGGQYQDLNDGTWIYHIADNKWTGGEPVPPDSRVYRTGPFHPEFYLTGPKPNAAEFEAWLRDIPSNRWMLTNPPHLPRLNRDWGTARIDPDRDLMLRWSGGHSAHGGSDVLHYHFATNRWELPFPVEFPLGQLYSNTSYPNGFNFNLRPWVTGHTYQNYDYDLPSKKMIKAGRPRHYYVYDPDLGDWIGRGVKPKAMQYDSCFYTLTLASTPSGIVCWDKNGKIHSYDHAAGQWNERELQGDSLPGAYVDNSSIVYDSTRDRVLMIDTLGYGKAFDGEVYALDLKTNQVDALAPQGAEIAKRFAAIDKSCYDPVHDLLLVGTYLKDSGDHTPTPAYDCAANRWITLDIAYDTAMRSNNVTRAFPHARSDALMFDARRKLIWGTDANGQVYVLRLDLSK